MLQNRKKIFLLGSSHLLALITATTTIKRNRDFEFRHIRIGHGDYQNWCRWVDQELVIEQFVFDKIKNEIKSYKPDALFMSIGGSEYFVYSAVKPVRDFDFFIPGAPDTQPDSSLEIVPYDLFKRLLRKHLSIVDKMLEFCSKFAIDIHYINTPPASPSDQFMIDHMPDFLQSRVEAAGLARTELRRKMWLVQREINQELCSKYGINFVDVPPSSFDEAGLMRNDLRQDAFHGSPAYGDLVLDQIGNILAQSEAR